MLYCQQSDCFSGPVERAFFFGLFYWALIDIEISINHPVSYVLSLDAHPTRFVSGFVALGTGNPTRVTRLFVGGSKNPKGETPTLLQSGQGFAPCMVRLPLLS